MPNMWQIICNKWIIKTSHPYTWEKKTIRHQYKCELCRSKFYYHGDLVYHIQHVQTEKIPCPDCDNEYKTNKLMKQHYNDVHLKIHFSIISVTLLLLINRFYLVNIWKQLWYIWWTIGVFWSFITLKVFTTHDWLWFRTPLSLEY